MRATLINNNAFKNDQNDEIFSIASDKIPLYAAKYLKWHRNFIVILSFTISAVIIATMLLTLIFLKLLVEKSRSVQNINSIGIVLLLIMLLLTVPVAFYSDILIMNYITSINVPIREVIVCYVIIWLILLLFLHTFNIYFLTHRSPLNYDRGFFIIMNVRFTSGVCTCLLIYIRTALSMCDELLNSYVILFFFFKSYIQLCMAIYLINTLNVLFSYYMKTYRSVRRDVLQ